VDSSSKGESIGMLSQARSLPFVRCCRTASNWMRSVCHCSRDSFPGAFELSYHRWN
jgi:hypothetical protein